MTTTMTSTTTTIISDDDDTPLDPSILSAISEVSPKVIEVTENKDVNVKGRSKKCIVM